MPWGRVKGKKFAEQLPEYKRGVPGHCIASFMVVDCIFVRPGPSA